MPAGDTICKGYEVIPSVLLHTAAYNANDTLVLLVSYIYIFNKEHSEGRIYFKKYETDTLNRMVICYWA